MRIVALAVMVSLAAPGAAWGGDLGRAKDAVHGDDKKDDDDEKHEHRHDHDDHDRDHDDDSSDEATGLWLLVIGSPFWVPHLALGDDFAVTHGYGVYPYQGGGRGLARLTGDDRLPAAGYVGFTGGWRPDDLRTAKVDAQLFTAARVGLATTWYHFVEPQPQGPADTLTVGDVEVTFRFAESERVSFWTGLGGRVLPDAHLDLGFDFAYGVDLFPVDPITVSLRADVGSLGHARVLGASGRIGVLLGPVDVGVGGDVLAIGSSTLTAITAGIRLWL